MADLNCSACDEIRQIDPNFVVNGFGDDECVSMQNDTGLVQSSGHDDFEDLNLMNDCLVGNVGAEVPSYDVCDWKAYMKKFVPNLWTTLKGIICAIKGIWTYIHKHECQIAALSGDVINFEVTEAVDNTTTHVVAGKGVSFMAEDSERTADVSFKYLGGALARVTGTLLFSQSNFTDAQSCWNFDTDAADPVFTRNRVGNSMWNNTASINIDGDTYHYIKMMQPGGELIYEIRIKKSEYPSLEKIINGFAAPNVGGQFQVTLQAGDEGAEMRGQNSDSPTHTVPEGWYYIQARMINVGFLIADAGHHYTPSGFMGIKFKRSEIEC